MDKKESNYYDVMYGSIRGRPCANWKNRFLAALDRTANIREACDLAGVSRSTVRTHRKEDPGFNELCLEALQNAYDRLEREAWRRAVEGYEEPVFYQGEKCGLVRRYSDRMLDSLLRANRPERFRENYDALKRIEELLTESQKFHIPENDDRPEPVESDGRSEPAQSSPESDPES